MNQLFLQVFCAIFSGATESISISNEILPFGSPLTALLCLSPLYIAVYKSKSYKQTFWLFFLQTLTVHLLSSYWLANFHGFAAFTLGASALGTAFQGGFCGIIMHVFPSKISKKAKLQEQAGLCPYQIFKRMLWFCACWVLYEYIKSTGALGYPWGTLFMAAYKWKIFTQIADITGVWGITFIYALFSSLTAETIMSREYFLDKTQAQNINKQFAQAAKFTLAVFALCGIYGIIQISIPRWPEKLLNAVIVQQNIDPWEGGDKKSIEISKKLTKKGIRQLSEQGKETDLVIWSEGVLSKNFPKAANYYSHFPEDESLKKFIASTQTPFLIGGGVSLDRKKRKRTNSAILFDKNGIFSGFYSKIQLVPFAERVPYAENPVMIFFMRNVVGFYSSLVPGFQYALFKIPLKENQDFETPLDFNREKFAEIKLDGNGNSIQKERIKFSENNQENPISFLKFSTPICFEDSFPSVCTNLFKLGSEIFINITNDSWSKTNSAEMQHFIASSYLAIEYRTTLLRCANSGYSVAVNPSGKILYDLPLFTESSMGISVPIYKRQITIFSVLGNWFAHILIFAVFSYIIFSAVKDISFINKKKIRKFLKKTIRKLK